jgi:hypothetical protein
MPQLHQRTLRVAHFFQPSGGDVKVSLRPATTLRRCRCSAWTRTSPGTRAELTIRNTNIGFDSVECARELVLIKMLAMTPVGIQVQNLPIFTFASRGAVSRSLVNA